MIVGTTLGSTIRYDAYEGHCIAGSSTRGFFVEYSTENGVGIANNRSEKRTAEVNHF